MAFTDRKETRVNVGKPWLSFVLFCFPGQWGNVSLIRVQKVRTNPSRTLACSLLVPCGPSVVSVFRASFALSKGRAFQKRNGTEKWVSIGTQGVVGISVLRGVSEMHTFVLSQRILFGGPVRASSLSKSGSSRDGWVDLPAKDTSDKKCVFSTKRSTVRDHVAQRALLHIGSAEASTLEGYVMNCGADSRIHTVPYITAHV